MDDRDIAAIPLPPPLIFGLMLLGGLGLGRLTRHDEAGIFAKTLALGAFALAGAVGGAAFAEMQAVDTSPDIAKPTRALAGEGVYAHTRNPLYVGMTSLYIGVAMLARSLPALVLLPVTLAILDRTVVDREERYLERRFGDTYRRYRDAVPRWF